jgi:hypothetical protein
LKIEADELAEKINKLSAFIDGDSFDKLPKEQRNMLSQQLIFMSAYAEVLKNRLAA